LPVDSEILAVLPHAHYLGKRLEGTAFLPDGRRRALLRIPDWDFNWQGDYRYAKPMHLPAGTRLEMHFTYDNSAANPRNPNQPPKRVQYGPQSRDEMAELWFQVRLRNSEDAARLSQAYNDKQIQEFASYSQFRLAQNPRDANARTELGFTEWTHGQTTQAMESFHTAIADDPTYDLPHYYLGVIYRTQNRLPEARTEFEAAIKLNPRSWKAFGNLARVFLDQGKLEDAEANIREALRLNPGDELARETLVQIQKADAAAAALRN
jgi:Flp pilus assembly protein TadD